MAFRQTRTMLTLLLTILGTGVVAFIIWSTDEYRAGTPLVFISGLILSLIIIVNNLLSSSKPNQPRLFGKTTVDKLWNRHIPQLVTNLYFAHIRQYPEWIKESPDYVPSSITNAGRTENGSVQILLYYAEYDFKFNEWTHKEDEYNEHRQGALDVLREDAKIISLRVTQTVSKKGVSNWEPIAIEVFNSNLSWIKDFENLKMEILAIMKNRAREARES